MLSRRSDLSARPKIFASLPNFFFVFFGVDDRTPKIPLYYFRQAAQKTSLFLFSAEDFDFGYFPKKTRRKSKRRKIFGWPKKIGECAEFLKEYHPWFETHCRDAGSEGRVADCRALAFTIEHRVRLAVALRRTPKQSWRSSLICLPG